MSWTKPQDLKAQLLHLWERGELLRDAVTGHNRFPLRLALKSPSSTDITHRFSEVREWAAQLAAMPHVRVEWQNKRHRVHGSQTLPANIWVDDLEQVLTWIGKRNDWMRFLTQIAATKNTHSGLLPWLEKRPIQTLALADKWPQLLGVVSWLMLHPRPGIYLRQADVPGVHSKFIESHRSVLAEMLDLVMPADTVNQEKKGASQFVERYGFLQKPMLIRFRVLDPAIAIIPGASMPDITLDIESLARLNLKLKRIFITENETNFLAFPKTPHALVIFGRGYALDALTHIPWLHHYPVYYWGDIDTHGFAILDQLRSHLSHAQSFLMDRATLNAHSHFWGYEDKPSHADLHRLTMEELHIYNELRNNRIRPGLRLEQEHIGFHWLSQQLALIERYK